MKIKSMKLIAWCVYAPALALIGPGFALAQSESAQGDSTTNEDLSRVLEEVIVTAERRDRRLQTMPIAATVLDGADLQRMGVNMVDQIQFATPSAVVNNFGQGIDFNIRGIGKAEHNTQTTTGVITYRDGVAKFPGYFTAEPYYDIQSVEVLRGPQGTFGGQNATGGAVFVHSRDPEIGGEVGGYVQGQLGNYSQWGLQGAVNLPVSDTFAARLAFNTEDRDSFYDISGPYTGDDGVSFRNARISLLWEPTQDLSVSFKTERLPRRSGEFDQRPVRPDRQRRPLRPGRVHPVRSRGQLRFRRWHHPALHLRLAGR